MTDPLFLDARLAQDNASLMSSTDMKHSMDGESGLSHPNAASVDFEGHRHRR